MHCTYFTLSQRNTCKRAAVHMVLISAPVAFCTVLCCERHCFKRGRRRGSVSPGCGFIVESRTLQLLCLSPPNSLHPLRKLLNITRSQIAGLRLVGKTKHDTPHFYQYSWGSMQNILCSFYYKDIPLTTLDLKKVCRIIPVCFDF